MILSIPPHWSTLEPHWICLQNGKSPLPYLKDSPAVYLQVVKYLEDEDQEETVSFERGDCSDLDESSKSRRDNKRTHLGNGVLTKFYENAGFDLFHRMVKQVPLMLHSEWNATPRWNVPEELRDLISRTSYSVTQRMEIAKTVAQMEDYFGGIQDRARVLMGSRY